MQWLMNSSQSPIRSLPDVPRSGATSPGLCGLQGPSGLQFPVRLKQLHQASPLRLPTRDTFPPTRPPRASTRAVCGVVVDLEATAPSQPLRPRPRHDAKATEGHGFGDDGPSRIKDATEDTRTHTPKRSRLVDSPFRRQTVRPLLRMSIPQDILSTNPETVFRTRFHAWETKKSSSVSCPEEPNRSRHEGCGRPSVRLGAFDRLVGGAGS